MNRRSMFGRLAAMFAALLASRSANATVVAPVQEPVLPRMNGEVVGLEYLTRVFIDGKPIERLNIRTNGVDVWLGTYEHEGIVDLSVHAVRPAPPAEKSEKE